MTVLTKSGHFNPDGVDNLDENYIKLITLNFSEYIFSNDLDRILVSFPPPFFKIDIHLTTLTDEPVTVNQMSSGERQFLYYMSTLMYHLKNLDSVVNGDKSVHYRIINIILEEVELYFHPEYQCQFVQKLINYLEFGRFNNIDYFNIIVATHSPFILSDIPKENIMYLREGKQVNDEIEILTFGSNVHDLLKNSFFLNKSFMGNFAKDRINEVIDFLKIKIEKPSSVDEYIDEKYIKQFVELVGEPLIKSSLTEMYHKAYYSEEHIDREIERLNNLRKSLYSNGSNSNSNSK